MKEGTSPILGEKKKLKLVAHVTALEQRVFMSGGNRLSLGVPSARGSYQIKIMHFLLCV